jgi:hypothetical protein
VAGRTALLLPDQVRNRTAERQRLLWDRVADLGRQAGVYYRLARARPGVPWLDLDREWRIFGTALRNRPPQVQIVIMEKAVRRFRRWAMIDARRFMALVRGEE